jgi:hypothetical protein
MANWESFRNLNSKLERAEIHIFKLKDTWQEFIDREDNPYPVISEFDANTGYRTFKLANAARVPIDIPLLAGDAIHNLRTAIDHLMYHLISLRTRDSKVLKEAYFPIYRTSKIFKSRFKGIKKFLAPAVIKAISQIKPYARGSQFGRTLWQLHQLDIIDKHKILLTVAAANTMHSMSPEAIATLRRVFFGQLKDVIEAYDARNFLTLSHTPLFDPKPGSIIAILPEAKVHEDMRFPFHVAFREPKSLKGKPVVEFLEQLRHAIYQMLMTFDSSGFLE